MLSHLLLIMKCPRKEKREEQKVMSFARIAAKGLSKGGRMVVLELSSHIPSIIVFVRQNTEVTILR